MISIMTNCDDEDNEDKKDIRIVVMVMVMVVVVVMVVMMMMTTRLWRQWDKRGDDYDGHDNTTYVLACDGWWMVDVMVVGYDRQNDGMWCLWCTK